MGQYVNVETLTLININNNKQHLGYWLPIAGHVDGGMFVSLCSNKRTQAHALLPIDAVHGLSAIKCAKCYK